MEHEDLLEKGFQLAHFLSSDRETAIQVLTAALDKVNAQHGYESKRAYWRDKYLKRRIYRIARNQADVLQWLIYFESEQHERQQERLGLQTENDLVTRYVKFLVQTATARSSFYVCVGVQRLLFHYSTGEAQRSYEFISDRYLGSDEYRRAKSLLMDRIRTRFGDFLRVTKSDNGELTFESGDSNLWADLVRECLITFTPWSTENKCMIPEYFHLQSQGLPRLLSDVDHEPQDQDEIEMNRCHCFIDPVCHRRLTGALSLDRPEARLALPKFFTKTSGKPQQDLQPPPSRPALTHEERSTIEKSLDADGRRRRKAAPVAVRILVDGNEVTDRAVNLGSEAEFEVAEGARLIEAITSDESGEFVLATEMIPLRHWRVKAPTTVLIKLRNCDLFFTFMPAKLGAAGVDISQVSLRFLPTTRRSFAIVNPLAHHPRWLAGLKYAFVGSLCIGLGWIAGTVRQHSKMASLQNQVADLSSKAAGEKRGQAQPVSLQLVSDELRSRSGEGAEVPILKINDNQSLVNLVLPVGVTAQQYRAALKPLLQDRALISEEIPQTVQTSAGAAIVFDAPTSFLRSAEDYSIVLSAINRDGTASEIDSFTFRVIKSND